MIFKGNRVAKEVKGNEEARAAPAPPVKALPRMLSTVIMEPEMAERVVEVAQVVSAATAGVAERVAPLR